MNITIRTGLYISALVLASATLNAQPPRGDKQGESRIERMAQELNLTSEQRTQVRAVFKELRANRVKGDRKANKELQAQVDQELQKILTPEQYEQWSNQPKQQKRR